MSRALEDLDTMADSAFGATQDETPAARSWPRRLMHSLVLLDYWSPDIYRLSSQPAARSHLRAE